MRVIGKILLGILVIAMSPIIGIIIGLDVINDLPNKKEEI